MNAIDTNVLIYFVDDLEPTKQHTAIKLLQSLGSTDELTILPWQVGAEFLCCLRRWENAERITRDDTLRHLSQLESLFTFVFPSQSVLSGSLALSSRYSLSHWDSMLLAACIEADVDTLYSEDLASGMAYDSVTVVNPFA
jgi:predicted nucleic acid-binding protein